MIRYANKFDNEDIIRLLKDFAINSDCPMTNDPMKWSKSHIEQILATIYAGRGFILIDEEKTGILVAVRMQCFWLKDVWQLQEVMLHGTNNIVMLRLIKEYARIARCMIDNHEIAHAMVSSYKDDRFERLGMKKFEIHWSIE